MSGEVENRGVANRPVGIWWSVAANGLGVCAAFVFLFSEPGARFRGMEPEAVHAAMAGNTGLLIGMLHNQLVHVPIPVAVAEPKTVELEGDLWTSVLLSTGQPRWR